VEFIPFIVHPPLKKVKNVNSNWLVLPSTKPIQDLKVLNRLALVGHPTIKQRSAIRFNFTARPFVKRKRKAWLTRRWWWLSPRRWLSTKSLTFRPNFKIRFLSRGQSLTKVKGFEPRWFFKRYTRRIRHPNLQGYRRLSFFRRPPIIRDKYAARNEQMDLEDFANKVGGYRHPRYSGVLQRPPAWAFNVTNTAFQNGQLQLDPYKVNTRYVSPSLVSRVCLVQGNRNFWGILHHRHKIVTHVSAGQMRDSAGSRRTEPPAIFGVTRMLGQALHSILQSVSDKHLSRRHRRPRRRRRQSGYVCPPHIARRYRKRWTPKWLKRTVEEIRRPKFHLLIKLKNYQPYKQSWWGQLITSVLKNAVFRKKAVKLVVTVETVVLRPHNGLRPRKPTRQ